MMITEPKRLFACLSLSLAATATLATLSAQSSLPPIPTLPVREVPSITLNDLRAQFPVNAQGSHAMEIPEILSSSEDKDVRALLAGRQVETVGEIIPKSDSEAALGRFRVARSQMQCCAAHARPCSITVALGATRPELKEGCWVRLTGVLTYEGDGVKFQPLVTLKEIVEITAPRSIILK